MLKSHSWQTASLVMALTAIMGLALPALGGEGRPFIGHYAHDGDAPGSGQATHLGRFTQEGAEGTEVFTAANGDQLVVKVEGAPTEACGSAPPEVIPICGIFTITGGTGRFSDVSGWANFMGVITLVASGPPHIAVAFAGTIQY